MGFSPLKLPYFWAFCSRYVHRQIEKPPRRSIPYRRTIFSDKHTMRCVASKVTRRACSVAALCGNASCSFVSPQHTCTSISTMGRIFENMDKLAISDDFLKWGSLGFRRTLSFAAGFTPLQLKPLEELIDIQRAKNKSSEELADIWDDFHLGRGHIGASMKAKL